MWTGTVGATQREIFLQVGSLSGFSGKSPPSPSHSSFRTRLSEFLSDPRLSRFDSDDRKFVAAAVASGTGQTRLLNAADSDYSLHRAP